MIIWFNILSLMYFELIIGTEYKTQNDRDRGKHFWPYTYVYYVYIYT